MEVRHKANKSRLTGFVAGLGPKTTWDKPEKQVTKVERTLAFALLLGSYIHACAADACHYLPAL